jgi:hypothetical protein
MNETVENKGARIVLALVVLIAFAAVVTVNALAATLPLNGVDTGTLSDEIPNLFVPAGLTFSIWGLIYLLLAALSAVILFQAFSAKAVPGAWTAADGIILSANFAANVGWIFAWHWRQVPLSLVLMLVILVTLVLLEERAFGKLSQGGALHSGSAPKAPALLRFALTTPIHVYLGWICVATIANVTAVLVKAGWGGWGMDPRAWTVIVIGAGLAVALGLVFFRRAVAAPLVVVWAYAGIAIKRFPLEGSADPAVWIAAISAAVVILAAVAASGIMRLKK